MNLNINTLQFFSTILWCGFLLKTYFKSEVFHAKDKINASIYFVDRKIVGTNMKVIQIHIPLAGSGFINLKKVLEIWIRRRRGKIEDSSSCCFGQKQNLKKFK